MSRNRRANYSIRVEADRIVLTDLGPWNRHPTITNDAEAVVSEVSPSLNGRRLFYIDSDGQMDELLVSEDGQFVGFAPGPK